MKAMLIARGCDVCDSNGILYRDGQDFSFFGEEKKVVFENCSLKFGVSDLFYELIERFNEMHPDFPWNATFEMVFL